jgi:hypothetical protein
MGMIEEKMEKVEKYNEEIKEERLECMKFKS